MEIALPNGKIALISDEDWPKVRRLSWSDKGGGYVRARFKMSAGGDGRFVYLHRFLVAAPEGYVVDHINGNPLDNRRENLQVTTQSRNLMRCPAKRGGVTMDRGRYRVRLRVDTKMVSFGSFATREEADRVLASARRAAWAEPSVNVLGTIF